MTAFGTSNSAWCSSGKATRGSNHSVNLSMPQAPAFTIPATTANPARITNGTVIVRSDSCGSPWPRYSPKKVRYTVRVM